MMTNPLFQFDWPSIEVIGFDLDDTLHFFKKASSVAAEEAFAYIARQSGAAIEKLRGDYRNILATMQSTHFVEDKPSREYRRGRFEALLKQNSLPPARHIDAILDLYDEALGRNLALKEGAYDVLRAAKETGRRVVIISEGPYDAQEMTLRRLGLLSFVNLLVTSSTHRLSKADGLFALALEKLGCQPEQILYIGDNPDRDYAAARALNIPAILLQEDDEEGGVVEPRIRSLKEVAEILMTLPYMQHLGGNEPEI